MLRRVDLRREHVVAPVFVHRHEKDLEVASMPGVFRRSVHSAADWLDGLAAAGFGGFLVFGVIDASAKDDVGSVAVHENNVVCELLREMKRRKNPMTAAADLCLCEYTDHGHCAPIVDGVADNDAALDLLGIQAANLAAAGADWIAPSGAMDGMVRAIRRALDEAGHADTAILSYSVKYAGAFYGPFRDAADSAPSHGDRRGYQMDAARGVDEAIREAELDVDEGADLVMVKPAGPYLDVIAAVRANVRVPVAAYQTSGEYAMHLAAERAGWIDGDGVVLESLLAMRRAGADVVITYHADRLDRLLPRQSEASAGRLRSSR